MKYPLLILLTLCAFTSAQASSLVYDLKVGRLLTQFDAFRLQKNDIQIIGPYFRKSSFYKDNEQLSLNLFEVGALINGRYNPSNPWRFEATTALEWRQVKSPHCNDSQIGFFDLLVTSNYTVFDNAQTEVSIFGAGGFISNHIITHTPCLYMPYLDVGTLSSTRIFDLGFGAELYHNFINADEYTLTGIAQLRFLHFFSHYAEPTSSDIQRADLLLGIRYHRDCTLFETGYNPTFIRTTNNTEHDTSFVSHGAYASISRLTSICIGGGQLAIGLGLTLDRLEAYPLTSNFWWLNFRIIF